MESNALNAAESGGALSYHQLPEEDVRPAVTLSAEEAEDVDSRRSDIILREGT